MCTCWRGAGPVVADKVPYHSDVGQTDAVQVRCVLAHCCEFVTTSTYYAMTTFSFFLFSRLPSGSATRSPLRIIVLGFYGLPVTQHCRQPGSVTTGRPLEMCVCQNNVSSTRAKTRPGPAQNHPQTTVQPSPTWNVA